MNKNEFIKSLENIKLVLGNGFDLHCGLFTNFSHYYCEKFEKFYFIKNSFKDYENGELVERNFPKEYIRDTNVWDVFFVLNTIYKSPRECKENWCDIEKLMLSSFMSKESFENKFNAKKGALFIASSIKLKEIMRLVERDSLGTNHLTGYVVSFVKARSKLLDSNLHNFGKFLLSELKLFEIEFGEYIYSQINDTWLESQNRCKGKFYNKTYLEDAISTIDELCNREKLVAIDSFNYSYFEHSIKDKFHNINGSFKAPIFGIDTVFLPNDWRYLFTKTSRRIDNDFYSDNQNISSDFSNAVIYGHSLNQADYNYFFSLFDELKLLDTLSPSVLVFAYSIYKGKTEEQIKSDLNLKISDIIHEYAVSKKLADPSRLLDRLSIQGRIATYKIPEINKRDRCKSNNKIHYEEMCKKMDEYLFIEEKKNKLKQQNE